MASSKPLKAEIRKFEAGNRVVVPKSYVARLGLERGDQIVFKEVGGSVVINRVDPSKL